MKDGEIYRMFRSGFDTYQIFEITRIPEHILLKRIAEEREAFKASKIQKENLSTGSAA